MSHNIIVEGGKAIRLKTAGKYCDRDIVVTSMGGAEDLDSELTSIESKIADLNAILNELSGVGYTVTLPRGWYDDGMPTTFVQYSLDGGSTWHDITEDTEPVTNVTQIMFRQIIDADTYDMYYYIEGDEEEYSWRYNVNYALTGNTEFTFDWDEWW